MSRFHHYAQAAADYEAIELRRTSDFQAALLGMAGHDLRQPLQIIQSVYEWFGDRVTGASEKARLASGERAIARLTEQLDGLVSALRLYEPTRRLEVSSVALAPLLWRIAKESEHDARESGIDLRVCPTHAVVMSNRVLLESILRNLVRNALKYTAPGGRILIGCRRSGTEVRIEIYDTGIGIAPEHLSKIFEAFHRLDAIRADGLGIGLFVVRRAVDLLGHRMAVSSALSRGSRFSVIAHRAMTRANV